MPLGRLRNRVIHQSFVRHLSKIKQDLSNGPGLADFITKSATKSSIPKLADNNYAKMICLSNEDDVSVPLKYFIETYGCQMNVSDSEIVKSVLSSAGHLPCDSIEEADLILTNTCAIRENAEDKVWHRLQYFQSLRRKNKVSKRQLAKMKIAGLPEPKHKQYPLVGVLGCMAERLKDKLLEEESVDFICGPDAYRDIPKLIDNFFDVGQKQANIMLSFEETYTDIHPVRETDSSSAFISIMRGCNNMCSFCIVPFTRGRERSRPMSSILKEIENLSNQGIKEIVLLGQNVNGYHDISEESANLFPTSTQYKATPGFQNMFRSKKRDLPGARFPDLLRAVATINPEMRVRFTSPHPKDFPIEVLESIAQFPNLCPSLHLPVQSGSSSCLERMRRGYSREAYINLVEEVRKLIPNVTISTDIIAGFCGETEEEHQDTLSLMDIIQFDQAFMFAYSLRERTHAARNLTDDVPEEVKQRRLREIIDKFRSHIIAKNMKDDYGKYRIVLVEGLSTRSNEQSPSYTGRTDGNKRVIFPATDVPELDMQRLQQEYNEFIQTSSSSFSSLPAKEDEDDMTMLQLLSQDISTWSINRIQSLLTFGWKSAAGAVGSSSSLVPKEELIGEYAVVRILKANSPSLRGVMIAKVKLSNQQDLDQLFNNPLIQKS